MTFLHQLRLALRSLSRVKGLFVTVVLTLALAIGANAANFSVVRGVLLKPLSNRDEQRLIYIRQSAPGIGSGNGAFAVPEIQQPVAAAALTDAQRAHLAGEQWTPIVTVAALPTEIRDALRVVFRSPTLALADPGQEFQVTDVVVRPDLPIRRLILAGCATDHCVVYYERGGIAHTFSIVLLRRDKSTATFEWGGDAPRNIASLDELKALMLSGKIKGGRGYW